MSEQNDQAQAFQQLDYALERGVNFIDTAEMYPVPPSAKTQGSNRRIHRSLVRESSKREKVVLATKVAGPRSVSYIRDKMALDHRNIHQADRR
ncbi:aldo/keto reductase [Vibrio metschnikovii]